MIAARGPRPLTRRLSIGRVHVERVPELDGADRAAVAEAFRDLPGLALLECGRRHAGAGWSVLTADPVASVAGRPDGDPFGRRWRSSAGSTARPPRVAGAPPFLGGLVGYLAYEFGRCWSIESPPAEADQRLP